MSPTAGSPTEIQVLTAPGRAAIASLSVTGVAAVDLIGAFFRPANGRPFARQALGRIVYGTWGPEPTGEQVVVARLEDAVEVHCHGGRQAIRQLVDDLTQHPQIVATVVPARPTLPKSAAVIEREAALALAVADTERTALCLLDQLQGALRRAVDEVERDVRGGDLAAATAALQELLTTWPLGARLTQPWRVVLVGPPNVGKSSLINAIMGYQRAIVFDEPGTTRDVLTARTAIDGWPVLLSDTAGLRAAADEVERQGVERTRAQLRTADCVVAVTSAGSERDGIDLVTAERPDALRVVNKIDLVADRMKVPFGHILTSAATGSGLDELLAAIGRRLVPRPPQFGAAVVFTERQQARLAESLMACQRKDVAAVIRSLAQLSSLQRILGLLFRLGN